MKIFLRHVSIGLIAAGFLAGCTSTPKDQPAPTLRDILTDEQIVSIPYTFYGKGVFMVNLTVNHEHDTRFLVDTGATQSALYRSSLGRLGLKAEQGTSVNVHGMMQSGDRPLVILPSLSVGARKIDNVRMAVLDSRQSDTGSGLKPAGLIGMDLLGQYRIYVDADSQTFNLIPRDLPAPRIPWQWETVELMSNPFQDDGRGLHFLKIRLGNHQLPALLDTGSEENLMSWSVSKYPQLKRAKRRLYENWMIEGAIGSFDPHYLINTKNLRSGGKYWNETEFVVMDFTGLEILGITDQPFLIAGSPLLARETFYLDFAENIIRFKPPLKSTRGRSLTSTNTVFKDKDRAE